MAEILNNIKTKEQARDAAKKIIQRAQKEEVKKELFTQDAIKALLDSNPMLEGAEELATLLQLPDEHFALLSPAFYEEIERSFTDINNQLILIKAMNLSGVKADDLEEEYLTLCREMDVNLAGMVSVQKIDFVKKLMGLTYNAALQAEGVSKRKVIIPIEYCNDDAKMPTYAHITDAGMDIYATETITINPGETKLIPTGIKVAIPKGYEIQVRPKSGRCLKTKLRIANAPGTIDAGYRDEIGIIVDNVEPFIKDAKIDSEGRLYDVLFGSSYTIEKGEKIAQLVLAEVTKAIFSPISSVDTIENDGRNGGFGSTGVK